MIPSDVANALRLLLPDQAKLSANQPQNQPVASAQHVTDALSQMVPGQRMMAEIQAMLPNGTYRAIVAQREITLALPFSAKAGDSLELEVIENDGKLTLAVVAKGSSGEAGNLAESVPTKLSQTGQLIGKLMGGIDEPGKRASPAPLNGNLPLVDKFPQRAEHLAPILQEALSKSGVFYEAHQARWVTGQVTTEALRQEPQGKALPTLLPPTHSSPLQTMPGEQAVDAARHEQQERDPANPAIGTNTLRAASLSNATKADLRLPGLHSIEHREPDAKTSQPDNPIPRDLTPIVQQQLDALATQNYAWQGQIWPDQKMWWEISENSDNKRSTDEENAARWQTRLKLSLPTLGSVNAVLHLQPGGKVDISITADSVSGEARLRENQASLRERLESAGLNLIQVFIEHGEITE